MQTGQEYEAEVEGLSLDDKLKVWLDYMVSYVSLNHHYEIIEVTEHNSHLYDKVDYPVLGATIVKTFSDPFEIKPFEVFTAKESNMIIVDYPEVGPQKHYMGIYSWYGKHKRRIFQGLN